MGRILDPVSSGGLQPDLVYSNGAYPARPSGKAHIWGGPVAPQNALSGDTWVFVPPATPRAVIWSDDWWTDVDGATGARVLAHAERLGLIDIRAAVISTHLAKGPGALDALLRFEGRDNMPIGCDPSYVPTGAPNFENNLYANNPHNVGLASTTDTSVSVMRRALAAAADGAVDIIETGYQTNLQNLLQSAGDAIDARTGLQLVTAKVRRLYVMGGMYPTDAVSAENNFSRDATAKTAANYAIANWPTPIYFLGLEVGTTVATGDNLQGTTAQDPLALALSDYGALATGRLSWDPMTIWLAALGDTFTAGYTTVQGTNSVSSSTGINTFTVGAGSHFYVVKSYPDRWYRTDLNRRLVPGAFLAPAVPPALVGVEGESWMQGNVPRAQITLPAKTTGSLATNLVAHFHADDLTDLGDAGSISHWEDRMRGYPLRQPTSANRPVFHTGISALNAVQFASGNWLFNIDDWLSLGPYYTVFSKVKFAVLPTGTQDVVALDSSWGSARRVFHLGANATAQSQAVAWTAAQATKVATAGTFTDTNWHNLALRVAPNDASNDKVTCFYDGAAGTDTVMTGKSAGPVASILGLGAQHPDIGTAENFVGYLHEVRIYNTNLNDATVASVVAAM